MIEQFGYDEHWRSLFAAANTGDLQPVRILAEHKSQYIAATPWGESPAQVSGRMRRLIEAAEEPRPAVGDFAAAFMPDTGDRAVVESVLPRKSLFSRADPWNDSVQALAANFDTALLCSSLNKEFNIARLERYLVMGAKSGARLAIVLTKADLCADVPTYAQMCKAIAGDIPVHTVSAVSGEGLHALAPYFSSGQTVAALGSSGVGKSTLVNALFGQEIMKTAGIREDDDKGRHTTVHRQIMLLPSGGLYMDTPGMRELGLHDARGEVGNLFAEIEALAAECRFGDCRHEHEPGCAVRAALESGIIDPDAYRRYRKLLKESAYVGNPTKYVLDRRDMRKKSMKARRKS